MTGIYALFAAKDASVHRDLKNTTTPSRFSTTQLDFKRILNSHLDDLTNPTAQLRHTRTNTSDAVRGSQLYFDGHAQPQHASAMPSSPTKKR